MRITISVGLAFWVGALPLVEFTPAFRSMVSVSFIEIKLSCPAPEMMTGCEMPRTAHTCGAPAASQFACRTPGAATRACASEAPETMTPPESETYASSIARGCESRGDDDTVTCCLCICLHDSSCMECGAGFLEPDAPLVITLDLASENRTSLPQRPPTPPPQYS